MPPHLQRLRVGDRSLDPIEPRGRDFRATAGEGRFVCAGSPCIIIGSPEIHVIVPIFADFNEATGVGIRAQGANK